MVFDGVDLAGHPPEDRGGVSRAGTDLQHAVAGLELQPLDHQRDDVGLRDRLAVLDGQRTVPVAHLTVRVGNEAFPGHLAHRIKHPLVANAAFGDLAADHLFALLFEILHVRGSPFSRFRGLESGARPR